MPDLSIIESAEAAERIGRAIIELCNLRRASRDNAQYITALGNFTPAELGYRFARMLREGSDPEPAADAPPYLLMATERHRPRLAGEQQNGWTVYEDDGGRYVIWRRDPQEPSERRPLYQFRLRVLGAPAEGAGGYLDVGRLKKRMRTA